MIVDFYIKKKKQKILRVLFFSLSVLKTYSEPATTKIIVFVFKPLAPSHANITLINNKNNNKTNILFCLPHIIPFYWCKGARYCRQQMLTLKYYNLTVIYDQNRDSLKEKFP